GAAAHRAADPAVVRRQRGGVDDLHAVLPGAAARRLRLCARAQREAARTGPGDSAYAAAGGGRGLPADRASRELEAGGGRLARQPHPAAARRAGGPALLPARVDEPASPGLVRSRDASPQSLPAGFVLPLLLARIA